MKLDAAEWGGNAAAFGLHVALVAALSLSLAKPVTNFESPPVFVEFVDDVGLDNRAPSSVPKEAPRLETTAPIEEDLVPPPPDETLPEPPRVEPTPTPPRETTSAAPVREQPRPRPRPRRANPGLEDLLDGVPEGNSRRGEAETAAPAAPTFDARAQASVASAIRRQVQPCANRQIDPGPGANRIRVTLDLRLDRSGRLARSPRIVGTEGVTSENARYEQRVRDLAVAAYQGCAPYDGLPPELYDTPSGGWSQIRATFKLP